MTSGALSPIPVADIATPAPAIVPHSADHTARRVQDRVVRYGFGWDPTSAEDAVFYWRSIHGIWYTPMDLRAFPFDRQNLLIQVGQLRLGGAH